MQITASATTDEWVYAMAMLAGMNSTEGSIAAYRACKVIRFGPMSRPEI